MMDLKVGLVGIGKLGTAMMTHWNQNQIHIGVYHPVTSRSMQFVTQFPSSYRLDESELRKLDVLVLALPATGIIPFISKIKTESNAPMPILINMATTLDTNEIKAKFPELTVLGVKYMGHSRDLLEHGNGLFITETPLPKRIEELYQNLGEIKIDAEACLTDVNKLATRLAIKAAIEIEREFATRGFSPEYTKRALTSLAPEVIRSYSEGNLGHFALEIVKEIKGEE